MDGAMAPDETVSVTEMAKGLFNSVGPFTITLPELLPVVSPAVLTETESMSGAVHPLPGLTVSQLWFVVMVMGSQFGELSITLMICATGAGLPTCQEKESEEGTVMSV